MPESPDKRGLRADGLQADGDLDLLGSYAKGVGQLALGCGNGLGKAAGPGLGGAGCGKHRGLARLHPQTRGIADQALPPGELLLLLEKSLFGAVVLIALVAITAVASIAAVA
ncbi:hypothetical protein [Massilia sp. X63]|uniref:hypothetical protein n=1 Tax=Massilia sp. X63 TaxID=3237285 RepID=UPI0034DD9E2D